MRPKDDDKKKSATHTHTPTLEKREFRTTQPLIDIKNIRTISYTMSYSRQYFVRARKILQVHGMKNMHQHVCDCVLREEGGCSMCKRGRG